MQIRFSQPKKCFESYIEKIDTRLPNTALSVNELKEAFFSLKMKKRPGHDEINFNIIKQCFGELNDPSKHIFDLSLRQGIFPGSLKIAKVTPIYKSGDTENVGNYRPISVLPCFSKILERIVYNHLYKYLVKENILYEKQFGFQKGYSTEHAITQLVDQIHDSFEKRGGTLGIFIDLSKAFNMVDHSILLKKLSRRNLKPME